MKSIMILCMLMMSFGTYANDSEINEKVIRVELQDQISQLSNEQQKQLLSNLQNGEAVNDVWEKRIESLSTLGTGIGAALNSTVKELGVTVNEFSGTPVGMLTIMVIMWHYVGGDLWDVFVGTLILLIGTYVSKRSFNNLFCIRQEDGTFRFNRGALMAGTDSKDCDGGDYGFWWLCWIVLTTFTIVIGLAFIA